MPTRKTAKATTRKTKVVTTRKTPRATKTVAKTAAAIERRNKMLEELPASKKRVMIAREVLTLLADKRVKPEQGIYVCSSGTSRLIPHDATPTQELREVLPKCSVCALGSIFIAYARVFDNIKVDKARAYLFREQHGDRVDRYRQGFTSPLIQDTLLRTFPHEMLREIEHIFEDPGGYRDYEGKTLTSVLKKIMNNIIKNKGDFKAPREL